MEPQGTKEKRSLIRIPLISEKVSLTVNNEEQMAEVVDITNEGVFIKATDLLKPKTPVCMHFVLPGDLGTIEVTAQVVRVNWTLNKKRHLEHLGMGLQFENVPENLKKILDAYVIYLRNKQIITVSKRIIEEFFGGGGGSHGPHFLG